MILFDSNYLEFALVTLITLVIYNLVNQRKRKTIPGPFCLPVVGYLPFIKDELHISLTKLAEKYGPIFRIKLGSIEAIVLNDYQSIVDTLVKSEVSARPLNTIFNAIENNLSMALSEGERWKEQRKFTTKKLRDFGVGKRDIEQTILHEINSFCIELDTQNGIPNNLFTLITGFTLNIILQFLGNKRIDNNSEYFQNLRKILSEEPENAPKFTTIGSYFPNLIDLCIKFKLFGVEKVIDALLTVKKFGTELVVQRENECIETSGDLGYIDEFIKEIQAAKKKSFT
ncbi:cytochrome P450 2J6-like protein, partial [Leptotrombidium deliense]